MSSVTVSRAGHRAVTKSTALKDRLPWWGEGQPPEELWPGVSLTYKSVWSSVNARWETHNGEFYFDPESAEMAVNFFPTFLKHHIGEFAGQAFVLREDQDKLLTRPIFGWKQASTGRRRFRKVFAFCPKGWGKALALNTPIATPTGWTTMGAIQVGDRVFDERGRSADVIATSDVMLDHQCYEVVFDDGSTIVADENHLWMTEQRRYTKASPRFGLRTTKHIFDTLRNSNGQYQSSNHSVALAGPIGLPSAELPVEPYVLGAWLGDGDSDCARITVGDQDTELLEHVAACGVISTKQNQQYRYGLSIERQEECGRGHVGERNHVGRCLACERATDHARRHGQPMPARAALTLADSLRRLGVLRNKHIPSQYLRASVEQRLALLQGLMDTDGYISDKSGACEFTSTSAVLAKNVHELILTLGIKTTRNERPAKIYGREVSRSWRMQFFPPADLPVFRLSRKLRCQRVRHNRRRLSGERRIVQVRPVASVPVRCISVSSPTQMFLAGLSMVPTHNSPWGAGTGIYLARYDKEPAAEVYAVAADIQQARIVHTNAKIMVESDPDLEAGSEVLRDSIVWAALHSSYRVLSSDASTKHGFRPHGVIFDEMHAQKNRDLYEALSKSLVKRRQPMMIIITHAGTDDEGIAFEEYDLAQRVLSGSAHVDSTLPVLFQIRKGEDWTDERTWRRVNPGHGTTVQHDAIAVECSEALAEPRKRNDFLRYHLNQWTSQATAWIPIEWWDACETTLLPDAELAKLPVAAGLDLAQKWDLASFVLVFQHLLDKPESVEVVTEENGKPQKRQIALNYAITVMPFFWIPENTMRQHEKEDGVPYSLWVEQGLVTATEGDIIDYTVIYNDITQKILPRFPKLKQGVIGYDAWGATDIATKLRDLSGLPIEEVSQNYSGLNEPSRIYEALIKGRRVYQSGHRTMRWCHENLAVKTDDPGRIKPVKPKNPSKRVDGGVAAIMGLKMVSGLTPSPEVSLFFLPRR